MKLTKEQRETIRMMFGGMCAYCGVELVGRWHVDHVEAIKRGGGWEEFPSPDSYGRTWRYKGNGKIGCPENDHIGNLFPACVKCNILKSSGDVEVFRSNLTYFAHSIPNIRTYSHVHHLMRFGKLTIDTAPVTFWFERYLEANKCS